MKEDSERYGEPYYHTWHQLPEVKVCPIHGRILMKIKQPRKEFLNLEKMPEMEEETLKFNIEFELKLARFLYDAYRSRMDGNMENITIAVRKKMLAMEYPLLGKHEKIVADMSQTGVLFRSDMGIWIKRFLGNSPMFLKEKILFCVYLFENYAELERYMHLEECSIEEKHTPLKKNFELLSTAGNLLKLCCKSCGYVFHSPLYAISVGFGCPECERKLSNEQILAKHLSCLGDGNYSLVGELRNNDVKIRHETCGKIRGKKLEKIMYGQAACLCEQSLTVEQIQRCIDGGLQRFELISYKKKKDNYDVVIRDRICGKTFTAAMKAFAKKRRCRVCDTPRMNADNRFREKMQLLVGDEYVFEEENMTYIKVCAIRHTKCGIVTKMRLDSFMEGRRCPLCYQKITREELKTAISECTDGKYEVVDINGVWVNVRCPDGRILKKRATYLFAELERPSKSDFFEYRCKKPIRKENPALKVYLDIKRTCEEGNAWTAKGYNTDLKRQSLNDKIQFLLHLGVIKRIALGKYIIVKQTD